MGLGLLQENITGSGRWPNGWQSRVPIMLLTTHKNIFRAVVHAPPSHLLSFSLNHINTHSHKQLYHQSSPLRSDISSFCWERRVREKDNTLFCTLDYSSISTSVTLHSCKMAELSHFLPCNLESYSYALHIPSLISGRRSYIKTTHAALDMGITRPKQSKMFERWFAAAAKKEKDHLYSESLKAPAHISLQQGRHCYKYWKSYAYVFLYIL